MIGDPTPRQLDALAAWWQCAGSNIAAAKVMGVTHQVMRNTLMAFRREQRAPSNVALAQRYLSQIEARVVLPATSHNAVRREAVQGNGPNVTPVPSVGARSRNISSGESLGAGEPNVTLVPRTGVRIVDLQRERLRKQMVQAGVWRKEPLHRRHAPPTFLESYPVNNPIRQIHAPVGEVQSGPHRGIVA